MFIIGSNNQYVARGLSVQSMLPHAVAGVYVASNGGQLAGKILDAHFCTESSTDVTCNGHKHKLLL